MSKDGQRTKRRRNSAENFNRLSNLMMYRLLLMCVVSCILITFDKDDDDDDSWVI